MLTPSQAARSDHRTERRAERLMCREISFIPHPEFSAAPAAEFEAAETLAFVDAGLGEAPRDLPGHLARMCEVDLLTAEQERALFRQMNYLKFRANALRATLDPAHPSLKAMDQVDVFMEQANRIRDHLIKANMRLVIAVVKKFVTPQHGFDELLSDGIYSLMQAVDKFDFDRGFRFSTYAYQAISRNAYRMINKKQKEAARYATDANETLLETCDDRTTSAMDERTWIQLRETLAAAVPCLDRREQFIIRSRYALGAHRKVRTFQYLADKLGVSKERVRQLERRAVDKLRRVVVEIQRESSIEPAMVSQSG